MLIREKDVQFYVLGNLVKRRGMIPDDSPLTIFNRKRGMSDYYWLLLD